MKIPPSSSVAASRRPWSKHYAAAGSSSQQPEVPLVAPVLTAKTQHDKDRKERNEKMSKKVINDTFLGDQQTSHLTLRGAQNEDAECKSLKAMVLGQQDGTEIWQEEFATTSTEMRRQLWRSDGIKPIRGWVSQDGWTDSGERRLVLLRRQIVTKNSCALPLGASRFLYRQGNMNTHGAPQCHDYCGL